VRDLEDATARPAPCFFDRGIPDAIAYAVRFGVDSREFVAAAGLFRYATEVFILPPWPEIFVNDELRGATFEAYRRFHDQIIQAYADCGYTLVEVPRDTVERRADFVVASVAAH
jgi:predicted ATPase